jgi:Zn-dependent protease/predicted transcriptional regulator
LIALLAWFAFTAPISGVGYVQAFAQWLLIVAVFACILAHELSHALVARHFGYATREILLLPIGGIAQMERLPARPTQELLVAIAGPATNLVIATLLAVGIALAGWPLDPEQPALAGAVIVPLFWSNLVLAAFNLLPAFPMDGGRVLRALLELRIGRGRATRAAALVGKLLAVVFVIAALAGAGTMLAIIGAFVWFAADQESATSILKELLSRSTVADAMIRSPRVIDAKLSIDEAAHRMLAEGSHQLAVEEDGRVAGVVSVADLAEHMRTPEPHGAVSSAMHRHVLVVPSTMPLDDVLEPLDRSGIVLVGERDTIIGMLTTEQLETFAALQQARIAA